MPESDLPIAGMIQAAYAMLAKSYTPYSHFKVGAALLDTDGKIWEGCNIENAAYTPSNCAERTAFFKAVSEGQYHFKAIAIVGGHEGCVEDFCTPCGVCRQVMAEFCNPRSFRIISAKSLEQYRIQTLAELLPDSFGPADLGLDSPEE